MASVNYQTLSQFLEAPFGAKDVDNRQRLLKSYGASTNPVTVSGYTIVDNTYMIHLKVPSDSKSGTFYDVVIQFFSNLGEVQVGDSLENYFIQFFSNSPSFIYRYAVLYKQKGYMIDALQEKMDPEYADTLPTATNKDMKLTYDKSLFYACHFLLTKCRTTWLSKKYLKTRRMESLKEFLDDITSYEGKKIKFDLTDVTRKFKKELDRDMKLINPKMTLAPKPSSHRPIKKIAPIAKIKPKLHTFRPSEDGMTIKPVKKAKKVGVKRAKTTTTKKPK